MGRVADSPCAECAIGPNSPFSEEVKNRIRAAGPHTCHWREAVDGIEHALDCFAFNGRRGGEVSGPLCATAVALAGERDKHTPVRIFNPDDVRARLPEGTETVTLTIDSVYGSGKIIIER